MAMEILQRHRKRKSQGMLGGLLTVVSSCCWCGISWRCLYVEWADEVLQEQAAGAKGEAETVATFGG